VRNERDFSIANQYLSLLHTIYIMKLGLVKITFLSHKNPPQGEEVYIHPSRQQSIMSILELNQRNKHNRKNYAQCNRDTSLSLSLSNAKLHLLLDVATIQSPFPHL